MRLIARVPATSANLGPGFDSLALALELCNDVTVDTDVEPAVSWEGEGADELPTDGTDMVTRAMQALAAGAGRVLPPFALTGVNRIPIERGLGSSAAAAVAGAALASALLDPAEGSDRYRAFSIASRLEGHADNAAAASYGGLTIAAGDARPVRLDPHPGLRPVVLVPERLRLSTRSAREALPSSVSLSDAAFNAGRAAMAVVALTARPELLHTALEDRLHQDVRLALVPEADKLRRRLRSLDIPVCVSGAGPTLLAFGQDSRPVPDPGPGWHAVPVRPRPKGVEVRREA
jgi:homoserine kinase